MQKKNKDDRDTRKKEEKGMMKINLLTMMVVLK
jgi:hypothetical protein